MARRPKDIFSYADALFEIVEGVAISGKTYSFEVESVAAARKMRGKFYAFREGLAYAVAAATPPTSTHHSQLKRLEDVRQWARVTVCWFDEQEKPPIRVCYMSKNDTPDARLYRKALASAEPPVVVPGEPTNEELEARLAARLKDEGIVEDPLKKYY